MKRGSPGADTLNIRTWVLCGCGVVGLGIGSPGPTAWAFDAPHTANSAAHVAALPALPAAAPNPTATPQATPQATPGRNAVAARPSHTNGKPNGKPGAQASIARGGAPKAYVQTMNALHQRPVDALVKMAPNALPLLVLYTVNLGERTELAALDADGHFSSWDLERASIALRDPATGNRHPVEPATLAAVYQLQTHFHAHEIRVVSGYRTPKAGTHSNHGRGRAIDLIVPGTTDEDAAKFARERGFSGVGVYPISGFIHVDVRDTSYFWIDTSAPGRPHLERGVLLDVAQKSDVEARARGTLPPRPFAIATNVDEGRVPDDAPALDEDEDEAMGELRHARDE